MEVLKMEKSIVFVTGSKVNQGEEATLHTATCECGNRIVAAKKEKSLDYFMENNKYRAKCCGSTLHYNGLQKFENGIMKEEVKMKSTANKELEVKEEIAASTQDNQKVENKEVQNLETGNQTEENKAAENKEELIKPGKNGVTKAQMIPAIKNNVDNPTYLQAIENAYTELFFDTAKFYIPDPMKVKVEAAIKLVKPEFQLPIGKRARKKTETNQETKPEANQEA